MQPSLISGYLNGTSRAREAFLCLRVLFWELLVLAGMLSATASRAAPDYTSIPLWRIATIVSDWVDPNFSDPERGQVLSAIEEWNAALSVPVTALSWCEPK